jgi:hypothetical protein
LRGDAGGPGGRGGSPRCISSAREPPHFLSESGLSARRKSDRRGRGQVRGTLRLGQPLPPVHVYSDGKIFWLFDGFHRVAAARQEGHESIDAEITQGNYADMEARWQQAMAAIRKDLRGEKPAEKTELSPAPDRRTQFPPARN